MARMDYPTLPAPWTRWGKGWRWCGQPPATGADITIQPTKRGWTARHHGLRGIYDEFAFEGPEGLQEWREPTHFTTPAQAATAAVQVWGLRPRIPNDGARAVAREYSRILNIPKSEMRKLTGKKFAKMQKSRRRALTEDQQRALLAVLAHEKQDVTLACLLMLTLGLRIAELATIRVDNTGVNVVGKGNKARHVPFTVDPRSASVVHEMQRLRIKPANPGRVQTALRRIVKATPALSGLTAHVLRHTFSTNAMHRAVDPKVLQGALGHRSFRTTLVYLSTCSG